MLDQPAIFLRGAGQKAGHIDEGDDRNIEGVAEAHEAGRLAAGVAIEHAGQNHRLIGDEADGAPGNAAEADHDIARESFRQFEEIALVDHFENEFLDVVGLVGIVGHQSVERFFGARDIIK